jgi:hypothetical protein
LVRSTRLTKADTAKSPFTPNSKVDFEEKVGRKNLRVVKRRRAE